MKFQEFCENFVFLKRKPISFADRHYLRAPYQSSRNVVLRCSRQVEKSTFLVNLIVYYAATFPGTRILFCCPREEQVSVFSNTRLMPTIEQSPLLRRVLLGRRPRPNVKNMQFANGSEVFLRSCYHSADSARGLSVDVLMLDEFQDLAPGCLPVLQETLSHTISPRNIITGTPKIADNHLEAVFNRSTACEWHVPCPACGNQTRLDEQALGLGHLQCVSCYQILEAGCGHWVPKNPEATWGDGYWINHLMAPWLSIPQVLARQQDYDQFRFTNECLGLPVALGDHIITLAEIQACAEERPMAKAYTDVPPQARAQLIAGIDWGAGGKAATVIVLGYMDEQLRFRILFMRRIAGREDPQAVLAQLVDICRTFRVRAIAADGAGTGNVYNRLLLDKLASRNPHFYAIFYGQTHNSPCREGALWRWSVDRSASIGVLFGRIKKRSLLFPAAQDCQSFFSDFTNVYGEYNDEMRAFKYAHGDGQPDDAMHAVNYALLLGLHLKRRI